MNHKTARFALLLQLLLLVALTAAAALSDPQPLFTDNTASSGPSTTVTAMEQALLDRINGANVSIDAAIYDFNRVSVRDALIAAHQRGVTVRIVADNDARANPGYSPHFTALENAGIPVVDDNRSSIMHNKFLVIDGQVVWSGSTNVTDNGFTYNHNNSLVFTSTQLADIYTLEFDEMFVAGLFGTAKTDNVTHTLTYQGIPVEIYFSPSDAALNQVIAEVNAADSSIHFGIFFFTDDTLRDTILTRMASGVTVSGVWDNLGAANQYSDDEALCAAGAQIKREDFGGKLHHKFMVIDAQGSDPTVITGSMNWTGAGDTANDENTLILHDSNLAQAYLAAFQTLYNALGPATLCQDSDLYLPIILIPDRPPLVTINDPANGSSFVAGSSIFFNGSASDDKDGDLSASLSWSSSLDGFLGSGASFSRSDLSVGSHTVTAAVTDSAGNSSSAAVNISVTTNVPPAVTITSPANGAVFSSGDSILFEGSASDPEDGDLSANLSWSSSLDGFLGSGASFSRNDLSSGSHTITASVTDSAGQPGSASVTISVASNNPPAVTITSPANGAVYNTGDSILFEGSASDPEDGDLSANLSWSSSLDGFLGSGASFSRNDLSSGSHAITASVTDSAGQPGSASVTISVSAPAPANVQITEILYNPDGSDVEGEYVSLMNQGGTIATMTGWTLSDVANHVFTFPTFNLAPAATVRVWTKAGSNSATDLYWGSGSAIWNNTGDTATLRNASGQIVDSCTYPGGGTSASCN